MRAPTSGRSGACSTRCWPDGERSTAARPRMFWPPSSRTSRDGTRCRHRRRRMCVSSSTAVSRKTPGSARPRCQRCQWRSRSSRRVRTRRSPRPRRRPRGRCRRGASPAHGGDGRLPWPRSSSRRWRWSPPASGSSGRAGPRARRSRSIAVLPLTNVSGHPDDAFFADGMTDVLIANLGSIEALKVISRTSVMAYRGSSKPPREIARELKVDAIVEGSALRSGDRVRITAQLIDPGAGTIIWSDTYERDMRDVMTLQGDVARAIARRIQTTLAPDVERRLAAKPVRPDVYEDYLKGRYFLYQSTPEALQEGRGVLQPRAGEGPGFGARARRARRPQHRPQLLRVRPARGGPRTGADARGAGGPVGRRAGRRPRVARRGRASRTGTGSPRRRNSGVRSS